MAQIRTLDAALEPVTDGIMLAVPREQSGVAMEATRALIRRGVRDLHLVALPTSTLQADLLIGAGAVAILETSAVSLGELGPAPRFTAAVKAGTIAMKDATCPAIYAALQAAEKGIPFMPLRGLIGSDLLTHRPEWRVIDNPFGNDDPVVLLPAIKPDVALFHAAMADPQGNVWIGRQRDLST
ncbi:MAG: CoA-transferase, partial [Xanthobacteraceae bacterium]